MEEKTDEMLKKEMIKKVDKRKIKKLIAMCFKLKDCEILGLDQLLEEWANKKVNLYKLLGNELKIERNIDISKDKVKEIAEEGNTDESSLLNNDREFVTLFSEIETLSPILKDTFSRYFAWDRLKEQMPNVNSKCLYCDSSIYFNSSTEKMSFSTLMHKVFRSSDIDKIVSRYLQKVDGNIRGKIYVSIDPFDYITMSMNKSNWTSCHSLHSDIKANGVDCGCFSAGVFGYMCDNVSLVAYKTDGEEYKYEFNGRSIMAESKNWRQMVFIHPEKCYFIVSRQYPFKSEIITKIVREMVEERIENVKEIEEDKDVDGKTGKWKVSRKCGSNNDFIKNRGFEAEDDLDYQENFNMREDRRDGMEYEVLHYNDMLHDFTYQFIYQDKYKKSELPIISIGSNPKCVICGEEMLTRHAYPTCIECKEKKELYF